MKNMKGLVNRSAITKIQAIIIAVVVIVAAIVGVYYMTLPPTKPKEIRLFVEEAGEWRLVLGPNLDLCEEETGIKVIPEVYSYSVMHEKLVTNMLMKEGAYDVVLIDNPWVGEVCTNKWLMPLDDLIAEYAEEIDIDDFVPSLMSTAGRFWGDGKIYMIPVMNYAVGLLYRKDLLNDPKEKEAFKAKYGYDLALPETVEEYRDICEFFTRDTDGDGEIDFYGSSMMAKRGYKIAEECGNYMMGMMVERGQLGAHGLFDEKFNPVGYLNSTGAVDALEIYKWMVENVAPPGAIEFEFDEAVPYMREGHALSMVSYYLTYGYVAGEGCIPVVKENLDVASVPGEAAVLGMWSVAIPHNAPNKDLAWEFIRWYATKEMDEKRAAVGRGCVRVSTYTDPEVLKEHPWYSEWYRGLGKAHPYPGIPEGEEIILTIGTALSEAVTGAKTPKVALDDCAQSLHELLKKAGYFD